MIWRIASLSPVAEILMFNKRHFSYARRSLAILFFTDVGSWAGSVKGKVSVVDAMLMFG